MADKPAWMRRVLLGLAAVAILALYSVCLAVVFGYAMSRVPPSFWGSLFATPGNATLAWMVTCHTAAVLGVSLPFAYLVHRVYRTRAATVAVGMTLALFFAFALPGLRLSFADSPPRLKAVAVFDQVKLLGALPLMAWAFGWRARSSPKAAVVHEDIPGG